MQNEQNTACLDANYAAWRTHDLDAICACYTDDCVYEDKTVRAQFHGKDGVRDFASQIFTNMPDFNVALTRRFATEHHGAGEWLITGTWNGEFEGVDCTGKKIQFSSLYLFDITDGKIAYVQDRWDYTVMMEEFGVLKKGLRHLR